MIPRGVVAALTLVSLVGVTVVLSRPAAASQPVVTHAVTQQQAIVDAAASQYGVPYCEGGGGVDGPSVGNASSTCATGVKGYDCMSLAQYAVYQGTGITVPLPPADLPGSGTFIPPDPDNGGDTSAIQPGDVVFFGGSSLDNYSHSGIYAGNNEIWDALAPGDVVEEHTFASIYSDYGNVYRGAVQYWKTGSSTPQPPVTVVPGTPSHGYDLVGSDGGVFVFHGNFYGSLPGLGVHVDDITGIVPTATDTGYFLVGADGGVFAFHAPFANSLPGLGVHVDDITGIAATADDQGYWLVGANGSVYAFGDARYHGSAPAGAVGITATHDGGGYWVVGANGAVSAFGDAGNFGDLPGLGVPVDNIVGIVVSPDSQGYNLIGSDGGVFSFGDAQNEGSLPGLGVHVDNVVGAVPT
ncbi:MAG TPA: NlpC/P60 family protein [Acidimicrobiales bacterium]|nr:NlpC/P60 family protein [Acidimicrobiales bacterium]